ncbi:mitochondria protoheme IX farnesyltransferase [Polychaeton citri CBS 116435]|uniref:Protoheme IX farnesyltransferase, mitochondrial n=1 Tax=Polychaeton citri CBS 116435 TaxID=1314669 RepID=A0A9P4Q999_9PEZI|nr:mitochondria protoheme IX farnesyltransferase [Polychaeton citri CBS 116435]
MPPQLSPFGLLLWPASPSICLRCARRLRVNGRAFSSNQALRQIGINHSNTIDRSYFWANGFQRNYPENGVADRSEDATGRNAARHAATDTLGGTNASQNGNAFASATQEPPHRRRKRLKAEAAATAAEQPLPLDASSTLSRTASAAPPRSLRRAVSTYLALTKPRLAFLIVLTTTASYSIYPVPALLSTSVTDAPSLSTLTLLYLTTGTFSTIASANTLNMLFEPAYDAQMSRTKNRPLVRGLVSKRAAVLFAVVTGLVGTGVLWYGVNPTTALLGAGNIALYAFAYTPLKRIHPVNTWVGAVVGAVPPLMGWCAAASQYSTVAATTNANGSTSLGSIWAESKELLFTEQAAGGWLLAALLFAWQFPHFFALSHGVRQEYAGAGYRMLTSSNYPMTCRVSLRYSLAMFPICFGLSYYAVTDQAFVVTSSAINGWMLKEAWRNWKLGGEKGSARALFWASVWQLPIVLVLAMLHKKGLLERVWHGILGEPELEDEFWDEDED